jgi:hypothetical protein
MFGSPPVRGAGVLMGWIVVAGTLVVALSACAPKLSPLQEHAWDAFRDCKQKAPSAVLEQIRDDGGLSYTAREGDIGIMQRCLEDKFGYRSR